MSLSSTTKMANRLGLNLTLTNIADSTDTAVIDFANEVSIEVTGELTWATGGQNHGKMIGFKNPSEGTIKISTQVTNMQMLHLITGSSLTSASNTVSFNENLGSSLKYYKIEGETVWQGEDGTVFNEAITAYKCLVKPNYSVTYNGSGDPVSLDVEFELAIDANGKFLDIERSDAT